MEANGELKQHALAFAPHVADPRLPTMGSSSVFPRWSRRMYPCCGRVGKVMEVSAQHVKLYTSPGNEWWWELALFSPSVTRYCYEGCSLLHETVHKARRCSACQSIMPCGAKMAHCHKHDYTICTYCLGRSYMPPVGSKVIRGPTWKRNTWPQGEDDREEGIIESQLVENSNANVANGGHLHYRVSWQSGKVSNCRGPPFQDVILAPVMTSVLIGLKQFSALCSSFPSAPLVCFLNLCFVACFIRNVHTYRHLSEINS